MALKGFDPAQTRVQQAPTVETPAIGMAARELSSLSNRLQSFSESMMQSHAEVVADKAANKALTDIERTGTFDKEEVYTVYGKAYNTSAKAAYGANAELIIDEKAQALAITHQNRPDMFAEELKSFTDALIAESPTPELRTTIGIYAGKMKNRGFGAIATKVDRELRDGRKVDLMNNFERGLGRIINSELEGDRDAAELQMFEMATKLDAMLADNDITPAEHQKLKIQGEYTITHDVGVGTLTNILHDDDLEGAIEFLVSETAEQPSSMTSGQFDKYQARLKSIFNEYKSGKKAEATSHKAMADSAIDDAITLYKNGKTPTPGQLTITESMLQYASLDKQHEYDVYDKANMQLFQWEHLSIAEKKIEHTKLKSKKEMTRVEFEIQEAIGKIIAEEETMSVSDPVGLALQRGVISELPNMSPDAGGVDGLLAGLKQMEVSTYKIQDRWGEDKKQLMSKETAKEWADYMNSPDVSINNKLEFIERVTKGAPQQAGYVFNQIGGKHAPTFLFASSTMSAGNREAARLTLKGKGADIELPSGYKASVTTYIGNALANFKGDTLNTLKQGVIDYSKGMAMESESKAIDGADVKGYFGGSIGYVVDYNGQDTILPVGVEEDDFEVWLDNIQIPGQKGLQTGIRKMTKGLFDWVSGDYQLQYVDDGKYYIRSYNNGKPIYHENKDGTKFILEYPKVK